MGELTDFNNRILILKDILADDLDSDINQTLFKYLMSEGYPAFLDACQHVKDSNGSIEKISCYREDGKFHFEYK